MSTLGLPGTSFLGGRPGPVRGLPTDQLANEIWLGAPNFAEGRPNFERIFLLKQRGETEATKKLPLDEPFAIPELMSGQGPRTLCCPLRRGQGHGLWAAASPSRPARAPQTPFRTGYVNTGGQGPASSPSRSSGRGSGESSGSE